MSKLPVEAIVVGSRVRSDTSNIGSLANSIRQIGLIHPPVVNSRNELVAGGRRLAAVKQLGWTEVEVRVAENLDDAVAALTAERDENTEREPLKPSEMVALGKRLEELERPKAEERKAATQAKGKTAEGEPIIGSGKLPEPKSTGDTRDKVAAALNVSGKTYEKAKAVVEAAEADPELQPVVDEMDRTKKVDPAYRVVTGRGPRARRRDAKTPPKSAANQPAWVDIVDQLARVSTAVEEIGKNLTGGCEPWKLIESLEKTAAVLLKKARELRRRTG